MAVEGFGVALYARMPNPDAPAALLVLADSLTQTDFAEDLVDSERRVMDEELRLAASDPYDVVHDVFFSTVFGDHPMGRPAGGRPGQIAALTPAYLAEWAATNVHAGRVAVVISGDVDPEAVCSLLDPARRRLSYDMSTSPEHREKIVGLARDVLNKALVRRWSPTEVAAARRRVAGLLRLEAESSLDDALLLGRYQLVGGAENWSLEHHAGLLGGVTVAGSRSARGTAPRHDWIADTADGGHDGR